jgi:hypothetical protein
LDAAYAIDRSAIEAAARREARMSARTLAEALVECVIPYEALLVDAESRKWIAPQVWEAMERAVLAAREVLASASSGRPDGG